MSIRKSVKNLLSWSLSTSMGHRSLSRFLSESNRFVLQSCDDHYLVYDPYDWIGENIWRSGNFQRKRTHQVVDYLVEQAIFNQDDNLILVEIGANIGTQTIYLMKRGVFDHVVAFEPNPRCFELLQINLDINHLGERSNLLPLAAGRQSGNGKLHTRNFNLGASSLVEQQGNDSERAVYSIEVRRVDDVLDDLGIVAAEIGLFWVDAEGFELEVLEGMGDYLHKASSVYFEYTESLFAPEDKQRLSDLIFGNFKYVLVHNESGFHKISPQEFFDVHKQVDLLVFNDPRTCP